MAQLTRRRVVVSGMGTVTAHGRGTDSLWRGLVSAPAPGHRLIEDWEPPELDARTRRNTDRFTQFAVVAADLAVRDAGGSPIDPTRAGVVVGTALGGVGTIGAQAVVRHERGDRRVSPFLVPMMMGNAAGATVSMRLGWQGPCETIQTACAASTHAIGHAARLIADGRCDTVLAGGAEAPATPEVLAGFANMRTLSKAGLTRPFSAERDGFVVAEGAAFLLLESLESARVAGRTVHGEILGCASTADAYDITVPRPDGTVAARCVRLALADAGVDPAQVRQVSAHGTGTKLNDSTEAVVIADVFGSPGPAVTSAKGVTGHSFGAAGAIEAVAALLSMRERLIPHTANVSEVDSELDLDVVLGAPRPWTPGITVSISLGFGGHNACLVLAPPPRDEP